VKAKRLRADAGEAIRLASNAWRWRQAAIACQAAGDEDGYTRATELAVLAESMVAEMADSIINEVTTKGKE
jgi:hypothetical protein